MLTENKQPGSHSKLALTVALALTLCLGSSFEVLRAQQAPTYGYTSTARQSNSQQTTAETNVICQAEMQQFANQQLLDFRAFITTNFQNKSNTGSLTDTAIARYKQMRKAMYNKYATYFPQEGALMLTEGLEPGACMGIIDDTLSLARREIGARAVKTSSVKKSTALIDKYQQINNQLGNLNMTFLQMKGLLDTFSAKLPCYISKSCNKG